MTTPVPLALNKVCFGKQLTYPPLFDIKPIRPLVISRSKANYYFLQRKDYSLNVFLARYKYRQSVSWAEILSGVILTR